MRPRETEEERARAAAAEIKDGEGKIDSLLRFYLQSIGSYVQWESVVEEEC